MTGVRLEHVRSAVRQYRSLDPGLQSRVLSALRAIGADPRAGKPLQGTYAGLRSYRVGDYRIVYRFDRALKLVVVYAIGHRREVYKPLCS